MPRLVKRNTLLLLIVQAIISSGTQLVTSLAGVTVLRFTGSFLLVGLPLSIELSTSSLTAYPAGHLSDRWGRRPVMTAGLLISGAAFLITYYSIGFGYFPMFLFALFIFGVGQGAVNQIRVAAIDMYPVSRKSEGLSYILAGSIIGTLLTPLLVNISTTYSAGSDVNALSLPWLLSLGLVAAALLFVNLVKPDTLKIAKNLGEYYNIVEPSSTISSDIKGNNQTGIFSLLRMSPIVIAIASLTLASGVIMIMITSITSAVLRNMDADLTMISLSVAIHVVGMYGLSMVWGMLSDRRGRKLVLVCGALLMGPGALIAAIVPSYWAITFGSFVIGFGWSAINISATSIIGDLTHPNLRGRVLGISGLTTGVFSVVTPLAAGWVTQTAGFPALGVVGIALSSAMLPIVLALKESRPGVYLSTRNRQRRLSIPEDQS